MRDSREVIDKLLRGRRPERVGVFDGPWGDTEVRNCNQGLEAILDQWIGVVRDESGAVVPGFEVEDWD